MWTLQLLSSCSEEEYDSHASDKLSEIRTQNSSNADLESN